MPENEDAARAPQQTPHRARRRTAVRVAVPVAVAAAVATGVGLVPALASDTAPNLPAVSAEQLVAKVLSADTDTFSGTVKISADLGLPTQLLSMAGGASPVPGLDLGKAGGGSGGGIGGTGVAPTGKALELLGGEHAVTVAADGPDRQRVVLPGGFELVHNGDQYWAFDRKSNAGVHGVLPAQGKDGKPDRRGPEAGVPTPQELAKRFLSASAGTTTVTVDGTEKVADRAAYRLSVKPAQQGSTIAEVRISVDAERGVPLGVQVRTVDGSKVFDAHFGSVDFARPAAKTFEFSAPKGAELHEERAGADHSGGLPGDLPGGLSAALGKAQEKSGHDGGKPDARVIGDGWTAVLAVRGGAEAGSAVKMLGKPVGGGTLVSTKVVNVLVTDDGRLFAGAVTLPTLQNAAK